MEVQVDVAIWVMGGMFGTIAVLISLIYFDLKASVKEDITELKEIWQELTAQVKRNTEVNSQLNLKMELTVAKVDSFNLKIDELKRIQDEHTERLVAVRERLHEHGNELNQVKGLLQISGIDVQSLARLKKK